MEDDLTAATCKCGALPEAICLYCNTPGCFDCLQRVPELSGWYCLGCSAAERALRKSRREATESSEISHYRALPTASREKIVAFLRGNIQDLGDGASCQTWSWTAKDAAYVLQEVLGPHDRFSIRGCSYTLGKETGLVRTEKWTRTLHRDGRVTTTAWAHGGNSDSPFHDSMSRVEKIVLQPGERFNSMQFDGFFIERPIEYNIWPLVREDIERNQRIIRSRAAGDRIDQDMRTLAARQEARKDRAFKVAAALVVLLIIGFILLW